MPRATPVRRLLPERVVAVRLLATVALTAMVVSAAVGAALWPHARDAGSILAAQDEPAQLADVGLGSALRNSPALISDNIEAALAANDADLANSFVELARDKDIVVSDELSKRVSEAVADEKTSLIAR